MLCYICDCICCKLCFGMLCCVLIVFGVVFEWSWMIGDIFDDVEVGCIVCCGMILVDCGNEIEWCLNVVCMLYYVVDCIDLVVDIVVCEVVCWYGLWVW